MPTATHKRFDVKRGISVNGLPFVDHDRNIIVNDLTVQGVTTTIDTRTITSVDPIISLGAAGKSYLSESIISGEPGRIKFTAENFADIAVGDAIKYETEEEGTVPTGLTTGTTYYVVSREPDVTSANYRTITISTTQVDEPLAISTAGAGAQNFTLNPLRDLDQDLGVEFNYVSGTPKKGFFGYKDTTGHFTFLLDTTYSGSISQSDINNPVFTGTKSGVEVKYIKLLPSGPLTSNTPAIDIEQTWADGGIAFKAFKINIINTASNAASNLLDIVYGEDQKLLLRKDGALSINDSSYGAVLNVNRGTITDPILIKGTAEWSASGTVFKAIDVTITDTEYAAGSRLLSLNTVAGGEAGPKFLVGINGEIDSAQTWNAAGTVFTGIDLQVTPTAFAAGSKLVNFYASDTQYLSVDTYGKIDSKIVFQGGATVQTALRVNVTDGDSTVDPPTTSPANSLLLDLQVDGVSKFKVDKDGDVTAEGDITVNGSASFEDHIDIQTRPNGSGTYEDNTRFQTSYVTIAVEATTATTINTFLKTAYVTGKYLIQVKQGSNYHAAEVLLLHAGDVVFMTEYAAVFNSSIIGTFDAVATATNINLTLTPTAAAVDIGGTIGVRITRILMTD